MPRRLRVLLVAVAVLLSLPPMLLAAAVLLVDPDSYKPRIMALVAAQTGRQLTIDGPIRIRWALRPTISITGARLSNLPGGSRQDMARVERIDATLSIAALLRHRVTVTDLVLTGPNILLEPVGADANWIFHADKAATAADDAHASTGFTLSVLSARVRNGMVTFHFPARTNVIGIRTLDYSHQRWTEPLRIDAVLVYRDFKPFTVRASSTPTGGTFDPWTTRFDLQAFDAGLQASGSTSLEGPYDLAVSMQAPALERLNQLLPSMRLPALHGLTLTTRLASRGRGDLPIPGETHLRVAGADLGDRIPGLAVSDLRIDLPRRNGVATLSGAARYRSQALSLSGTFGMPATFDGRCSDPVMLAVATAVDPAHPASFAPDTLALHGTLALDGGRFDGFDGGMSLHAARLAAFRPVTSPALPALTALSLESGLALPAGLDRVSLQHLSLRAAEADLDGNATLGLGDAHGISATLHSGRLSLDPLLPTARKPDGAEPFMTTRLPWSALCCGMLDLSWKADHVGWHGQDWPGLALQVALHHGLLSVDLPGGPLHGHASVRAGTGAAAEAGASKGDNGIQDNAVPVGVTLQAASFPLQPLAGLAGLPGPVTGSLRLGLDLSGHGGTPQALADTLQGSVVLATTGASISNQALSVLAAPALKQLGARPPPGDRTQVRCFGLRGTVAGGVVKLSSIALDAGSLVLSGVGEVDLPHRTLALRLSPLARLAGSRVAVPVLVQGPFSAPSARLDAGGLDKAGLLLDALFGGDHPKTCQAAGLAG